MDVVEEKPPSVDPNNFRHKDIKRYEIVDEVSNKTNASKPVRGPQLEATAGSIEVPGLLDTGSNLQAVCNNDLFRQLQSKGCPVRGSTGIVVVLADRTLGRRLPFGVPEWLGEMVMPVALAVMVLVVVWHWIEVLM